MFICTLSKQIIQIFPFKFSQGACAWQGGLYLGFCFAELLFFQFFCFVLGGGGSVRHIVYRDLELHNVSGLRYSLRQSGLCLLKSQHHDVTLPNERKWDYRT